MKASTIIMAGGGIAALWWLNKRQFSHGSIYGQYNPANVNAPNATGSGARQRNYSYSHYRSVSPVEGSKYNTSLTLPHKRYPVPVAYSRTGASAMPGSYGARQVQTRFPVNSAAPQKIYPSHQGNTPHWWGTYHSPLPTGGVSQPQSTPTANVNYQPYDYSYYNPYNQPYAFPPDYGYAAPPAYVQPPNYQAPSPSYQPNQYYSSAEPYSQPAPDYSTPYVAPIQPAVYAQPYQAPSAQYNPPVYSQPYVAPAPYVPPYVQSPPSPQYSQPAPYYSNFNYWNEGYGAADSFPSGGYSGGGSDSGQGGSAFTSSWGYSGIVG